MKVAIVKYNSGNIQSVTYALNRLGVEPVLTDDEEELRKADKVIFPGVGEASTAMMYLREKNLDKVIPQLKQPTFGVCLGLQLMCSHSEENDTDCLGIFPIQVKKFSVDSMQKSEGIKVPHMGWNTIGKYKSLLFKGLKEDSFVYFVHSYYAELSKFTVAQTEYIVPYSSAIQKDNFFAVQFHPEKSSIEGEKIIKNFLDL